MILDGLQYTHIYVNIHIWTVMVLLCYFIGIKLRGLNVGQCITYIVLKIIIMYIHVKAPEGFILI